MPENNLPTDDLRLIRETAIKAGDIAMGYFRSNPQVWYKNGTSPVSEADMAVNTFLHDNLRAERPDYGWLSEETADDQSRLSGNAVFVVDPIDGTRAFVKGDDRWCVSVAVVRNGLSTAGVLVCPARGEVFEAHIGADALKNGDPIHVCVQGEAISIAAAQSVLNRLPKTFMQNKQSAPHVPSLAYRIAMVADGRLDATLVRPDAHDWDLAAADLILRRAGGAMVDPSGAQLRYDRKSVKHGVLIAASKAFLPELCKVICGIDL